MERRHDTYLLTPGPLTTSDEVKAAMHADRSPNSPAMVEMVTGIRDYLLELANARETHECVPIQGSATYGIEAACHTLIDKPTAKVLVVVNGFYGIRLAEVMEAIHLDVTRMELPIVPPVSAADVEEWLDKTPGITHLALCHCDTGTGILNPLAPIAEVCRRRGVKMMVDAIASFAGFEIDVGALDLEALF
ncbi:MAG: aminotransferase class V-fold PLP-dependent enzyme, partial [Pseudomonadota bacterium]